MADTKKILVIEDNEEVRENLEEILELHGYNVHGAQNGKIGVEQAIADPPDLILCDVMMPELDGFGVLNILSNKATTAHIPFIFLTAKSDKTDIRRGMNLGADDYITKPFYKDELLQVIETRMAKVERLRKATRSDANQLSSFINEARGFQELEKLSEQHQLRDYPAKKAFFEEGEYPRYLFQVKSGKVKVFKTNENGKEFIINVLKAGDFFGYTALIQDAPYSFSAAALDDSEVSQIPKEAFTELLFGNRDVSSRLIKMLADNVAEKEQQLLDLAYNSVRKRVADTLVYLYDKYQQDGRDQFHILREDLAQIVGTAKESVIRMLSEFRADGYIDIRDGGIVILEREKLKNMYA